VPYLLCFLNHVSEYHLRSRKIRAAEYAQITGGRLSIYRHCSIFPLFLQLGESSPSSAFVRVFRAIRNARSPTLCGRLSLNLYTGLPTKHLKRENGRGWPRPNKIKKRKKKENSIIHDNKGLIWTNFDGFYEIVRPYLRWGHWAAKSSATPYPIVFVFVSIFVGHLMHVALCWLACEYLKTLKIFPQILPLNYFFKLIPSYFINIFLFKRLRYFFSEESVYRGRDRKLCVLGRIPW